MNITLILAQAENGVIGNKGQIPWRISEDMKRFKALTMGKPVLMGRKTWESLPKKPLPGRTNIILTRDPNFFSSLQPAQDKVIPSSSVDKALEVASQECDTVMVIGGAEIYRMLLPRANRIELTQVHKPFEGDATFEFDRTKWRQTARETRNTPDGLSYSFVTLTRQARE